MFGRKGIIGLTETAFASFFCKQVIELRGHSGFACRVGGDKPCHYKLKPTEPVRAGFIPVRRLVV